LARKGFNIVINDLELQDAGAEAIIEIKKVVERRFSSRLISQNTKKSRKW